MHPELKFSKLNLAEREAAGLSGSAPDWSHRPSSQKRVTPEISNISRILVFLLFLLLWFFALRSEATVVGGTLTSNTVWSPLLDTILVFSGVVVPNGITLTITAGPRVELTNNVSISVQAGGVVDIEGTASSPVTLLPMTGNNWGTLNASGNNSSVTIRHAELSHGGVLLNSQSTGLIEDSYLHDYGSQIVANSARMVTLRRIHLNNYFEAIFNSTLVLAEDSLFENLSQPSSDPFELQGTPPGCVFRRCTIRHSRGSDNNSDGFDCNACQNVLVEDCLIYDVVDKGISLGAAAAGGTADFGITVRNTLIYNTDTGIAIKDGSTVGLYSNTIASSTYGLRLYQKFTTPADGGHVTNGYNNIIWGNTTSISLRDNSSAVMHHSDVQDTNWPGTGNISSDPLFLNSGLHDYRLAANSPAAGTGLNGGNMGVRFPVGAPMALSHPRIESLSVSGNVAVIRFWADSEKSYSLQCRDQLTTGIWTSVTNVPTRSLPLFFEVTNNLAGGTRFYQLVTPQQP